MDDVRGTPVSAAKPSSLEDYETALNAFNCYRGHPVEIIDKALNDDPGFVMGRIFRAHIHVSMWEHSVLPELNAILATLYGLSRAANERERAHVVALKRWAAYGKAIDLLMPVRYRANLFGGSHAQRDIIHRTLIEGALRAPDKALAIALTNERASLKLHYSFSLGLSKRAAAIQ